MARRLVSAIAGTRLVWRCARASFLVLALAIPAASALGKESDEAYSATVKVDATADSAAAARDLARIDGQRRALADVIERLSNSPASDKSPKLDDKAITDMVESFEVANERMSAVRYIADYTFHFRPSKIRRLVRVVDTTPAEGEVKVATETGAAAVENNNRAVVVLPVYRDGPNFVLWDDPNEWRAAWGQQSTGSGPAQLVLPLGDARDLATIDAQKARSGAAEALNAIAQRNGSTDAVVAEALARRQGSNLAGLEVSIKRYRSGRLIDTQGKSFDAAPGEDEADFMRRIAEAVAGDIESSSKTVSVLRADQQASMMITVPITSLEEWLRVRDRLSSIPSIRKIELLSLNRQEARIQLKYVGSQDQLKSSLSEASLEFGGGDSVWRIRSPGATISR